MLCMRLWPASLLYPLYGQPNWNAGKQMLGNKWQGMQSSGRKPIDVTPLILFQIPDGHEMTPHYHVKVGHRADKIHADKTQGDIP